MAGGTEVSAVTVSGTSTVNVNKVATIQDINTNATGYYNGYIYTQDWGPSNFTLLRVDANGTTTSKTVAGITKQQYNNAGIDKNGIMYILYT